MVEAQGGGHFESIPEAVIPEGTWKYIQIEVKDKVTGKERLFVRGYENHGYHADIFATFESKELKNTGNFD